MKCPKGATTLGAGFAGIGGGLYAIISAMSKHHFSAFR
jgi:hypothetical protein